MPRSDWNLSPREIGAVCGFAGFVSFGKSKLNLAERAAVLARMGRAIAHRGPDDEQTYDDGTLSLVFRRLSIIDLSGGQQPIRNARGNLLTVVNGEIYNHRELRAEFAPGHPFATHSDCELPMHVIERDGVSGLTRLDGMFSILVWDQKAQQLLLARDRMGIKPLYVVPLQGGLLFGSELKAVLAHPECPREIDWDALIQPTFLMRSPVPTYVKNVEHLPGGHYLLASTAGLERAAYWRIDDHLGSAPFSGNEISYREAYDARIESAVTSHLLSDVPVGLHLSGGIDSSLIAAIAAKQKSDLACFTVVERTSFRAGDVESARKLTTKLGLPWHPVLFDFRTFLDDIQFDLARFEQSVSTMDSPRFNPEWFLKEELHRFSRRVHPSLKVVLLGQGADEFAGGYSNRIDCLRQSWTQYLIEEVRPNLRLATAVAAHLPDRFASLAADAGDPGIDLYHRFMRQQVNQLQCYNLWHEDRTSMSQSLEARVPFLDHHVVELLASVPASLHERLFFNKSIVRDALQRRVPEYDRNHPKVPFVSTDDQRSIQIIVHEMLRRVAPAFIEKYLDGADGPFDVAALRGQIRRTISRAGAFYEDSWRLLECMAVAVFVQQCKTLPDKHYAPVRNRKCTLPEVSTEQWNDVRNLFSIEPVLSRHIWRTSDKPALPIDSEVWFAAEQEGAQRCALVSAGTVVTQINVPKSHGWAVRFLRNLGHAPANEFTVADWIEEFELPPEKLTELLDVLYQAGFILPDAVLTASA